MELYNFEQEGNFSTKRQEKIPPIIINNNDDNDNGNDNNNNNTNVTFDHLSSPPSLSIIITSANDDNDNNNSSSISSSSSTFNSSPLTISSSFTSSISSTSTLSSYSINHNAKSKSKIFFRNSKRLLSLPNIKYDPHAKCQHDNNNRDNKNRNKLLYSPSLKPISRLTTSQSSLTVTSNTSSQTNQKYPMIPAQFIFNYFPQSSSPTSVNRKRTKVIKHLKRLLKSDVSAKNYNNKFSTFSTSSIFASATSSKSPTITTSFSRKRTKDNNMKFDRILGEGIGGKVHLITRTKDNKIFAVKQFTKRQSGESEKHYVKKILSEFCIASILDHQNIIKTFDIVKENNRYSGDNDQFYQIMEYAPYDFFEIVMSRKMSTNEMDCCFAQIVNGVNYLHGIGIAHRDLKLDNIMMNENGIIKIVDFGCSIVFRYPFSDKIILSKGPYGSDPYISPESYDKNVSYDPRLADTWALGIIYFSICVGRFPWLIAKADQDSSYRSFLRKPNYLFDKLPAKSRFAISKIIEPDINKRVTIKELSDDEWFKNIKFHSDDHQELGNYHHSHILLEKEKSSN